MGFSYVFTLTADFSDVTLYLVIATASAALYLIYRQLADSENWTKYGVKQASIPIIFLREGFEKLINEHGDTVGIKRDKMSLLTRDLSILKEVMVKDFNNFTDRPFELISKSLIRKGVFFLKGEDWRRIRHIITPSFSTGKLKNIFRTVEERARKLTKVFEEYARKDKLVPIKYISGQYTSEIIARSAFGLHSDCLGEEDDEFTYYSKKLFKFQNKRFTFLLPLLGRFPWIQKFFVKVIGARMFDGIARDSDDYLNGVVKKSLEERKEAERKGQRLPADMLQSLISAKNAREQDYLNNQDERHQNTTKSTLTTDQSLPYKISNKTMTEEELIGQSLLIIFAGFETTSSTLQMCYYLMAQHPDVQEKLYEEIERVVQSESPTYEELSQLTYMEQVINETLRLYPPVSFISRLASETKTYGNITIPKGASVFIPIFSILKDPKHFPDPEKFDPERFTEENVAKRDALAFMPFGAGPRLCIGMRLAYIELKMALAFSIRKVQFELNDRTEPKKDQHPLMEKIGILVPKLPIHLCVKFRH